TRRTEKSSSEMAVNTMTKLDPSNLSRMKMPATLTTTMLDTNPASSHSPNSSTVLEARTRNNPGERIKMKELRITSGALTYNSTKCSGMKYGCGESASEYKFATSPTIPTPKKTVAAAHITTAKRNSDCL